MNEFKFQGQITALEIKTTQAGKNFAVFSVSAEDSYNPQKILQVKMTAFGKASDQVIGLGEFANVSVSGKIDSREYQGKHYLDLKALNVAPMEG
ncbi:MAG: DUF3127 domain-containing protein [Gammaproteobacteria bacterium]|nr:DUF3127 domain-containing protein [Gammaproteobacteria bacterium]